MSGNKVLTIVLLYYIKICGDILALIKSPVKETEACIWDKKNLVLSSLRDEEAVSKKDLEKSSWYQKDYDVRMTNGGKKSWKKEEIMAPDKVFALEDTHTYTALNERVQTYSGFPGAATLDFERNKLKLA